VEPLPEEGVDLGGREPVAQGLELAGVGAGTDAVVQGLERDPPMGQLPLHLLVAVQAEV